MVKVSVIVPVYNGEDTIARCIESIRAQTFGDIEIIVVNDGSTDGTLDVVGKISDSRIKVINIDNSGQGIARNHGMDAAGGEYISFVDSDDTVYPDMIEKLYDGAEKNGADMAQCDLYDIYPDGTGRKQIKQRDETVEIKDRGAYTDLYFTPSVHSYEVCNKLIKRSVIGDLRFKDTRKYFSEDLLFNMELIGRLKKVTFISGALYNYYQTDASHMHKNAPLRLQGLILLFRDYIKSADKDMKEAVSYTAAMILSYSSGECYNAPVAREMFKSREFKGYLKKALRRRCKLKHRIFITAMRCLPSWGKGIMCEKYSERWK